MDQPTNTDIFDYSLTPSMNQNLKEAARWCRFLSIIGFIFLGLLLIGGTLGASALMRVFETMIPGQLPMMTSVIIAIVVVVVLFGTFLFALLYRFAIYTRKALETNDETLFIKGVQSLKLYFIIYGVIGVLSLFGNITKLLL